MESNYFDDVTVISLPRRPERLFEFQRRLIRANWKFLEPRVFHAVDGSLLPNVPGYDRKSVWGCTQSHLRVLEQALIVGARRICVFEDDACFVPDFSKRLDEFLDRITSDWEVLLLGANNITGLIEIAPGVVTASYSSGTQCYALQGHGIQDYYLALAQAHRADTRGWPDVAFWSYGFAQTHKIFLPVPTLVGQAQGYSDITQTIRPDVF